MSDKTVLIVDDHPVFREGLKAVIQRNPVFRVAAEAGTGEEARTMAQTHRPDLVIMDLHLPDANGLQLTREIKSFHPGCFVLVVTMHSKTDYVVEAFRSGANGYVIKGSPSDKLLEGLNTVAEGKHFIDDAISRKVLDRLLRQKEKPKDIASSSYSSLSPREQEVFCLVAEGLTSRQIAKRLSITSKTVDNHRSNIMRKLKLDSLIDLVRYAVKLGLIDLADWQEPRL